MGDSIEVMLPGGNQMIEVESIEDEKGRAMTEVPGGGYRVHVNLQTAAPIEDVKMGLMIRHAAQPVASVL